MPIINGQGNVLLESWLNRCREENVYQGPQIDCRDKAATVMKIYDITTPQVRCSPCHSDVLPDERVNV